MWDIFGYSKLFVFFFTIMNLENISSEDPNLYMSGSLKIVFGILIFVFITCIMLLTYLRSYIIENLDHYECQRYIIPIISFFDSKRNATNQMKKCNERHKDKYFSAVNEKIKDTTNTLVESGQALAEGINLLTMSAELTGDVTANKLDESNKHLSVIEVVMHYSFMKLKAFFDKLGALVQNAYFALLSIMDAVNVIFVIPDLIMKILAFLIMTFGLVLALLIFFFLLNYVLGISLLSLGFSFLSNPFTAVFGAVVIANGTYILNMIAIFIYLSAITVTLLFFGALLAAYVPLKQSFDSANKASYCCFGGSTFIVLKNYLNDEKLYQKIATVQLKSKLFQNDDKNDNVITGKLYIVESIESINPNDYVIVYGNDMITYDIVYKTHLIEKNGLFVPVKQLVNNQQFKLLSMFQKVKQSQFINEILKYRGKFCLVTSQNQLLTMTEQRYTDFQEYPCCSLFAFNEAKMNLMNLNLYHDYFDNFVVQEYEYLETSFGFSQNTLIKTIVNENSIVYKKIKDINITDLLYVEDDYTLLHLSEKEKEKEKESKHLDPTDISIHNTSHIMGIYKCVPTLKCMGKLQIGDHHSDSDIVISGHQIIYDSITKMYIKAYTHPTFTFLTETEFHNEFLKSTYNNDVLYHLILQEEKKSFSITIDQINHIFVKDFLCK